MKVKETRDDYYLGLFKKQRECFIRTCDGRKIITNPLLYSLIEKEIGKVADIISRENTKKIKEDFAKRNLVCINLKKEGKERAIFNCTKCGERNVEVEDWTTVHCK